MAEQIKFTQLPNVGDLTASAIIALAQAQGGDYASYSASLAQVAELLNKGISYEELPTEAKDILGAITEIYNSGGGGGGGGTPEIYTAKLQGEGSSPWSTNSTTNKTLLDFGTIHLSKGVYVCMSNSTAWNFSTTNQGFAISVKWGDNIQTIHDNGEITTITLNSAFEVTEEGDYEVSFVGRVGGSEKTASLKPWSIMWGYIVGVGGSGGGSSVTMSDNPTGGVDLTVEDETKTLATETDLTELSNIFVKGANTLNLVLADSIKSGYVNSNQNGRLYEWANADYTTARAIVEGGTYITVNAEWANNSYGLVCDVNGNILGNMRDNYRVSSKAGYVYQMPPNANFVQFSANTTALSTKYNSYGFVFLKGDTDIASQTRSITNYPYRTDEVIYYGDNIHLLDGRTIGDSIGKVYRVEKDGTGDFDKLVDCIKEATNYMDSIVYVGRGTWNIINELGNEYIESVSSDKRGIVLKNRVHLICSSYSLITCKYTGTRQATREWLSAFNIGEYGATIENATIETENIRYSVHDEMGYMGEKPYINKYINCRMTHTNGFYINCIGGGLGIDGYIELVGCRFIGEAVSSNNRLVYYHGNNESGITNAKSKIVIKDCYFDNLGTFGVTVYGDSSAVSEVIVTNCSVGSPIIKTNGSYAPHDNILLIAWNNELRS